MINFFSKFIKSKTDSIIYTHKQKGCWGVIRAIIRKAGFSLYTEKVIFLYLDLLSLSDTESEKPFLRILDTQEILNQNIYYDGFNSRNQAINKIAKGDLLFAYEREGKFNYFVWIEQNNISIDWFRFDLPKNVAYLANEFVMPEYRGQGIAKIARKQLFHHLKNNGIRFIILVINPKNEIALKLNKSFGFEEYQSVTYMSFFYFRYYEITSANKNQKKKFISFISPIEDLWKVYAEFYNKQSFF